MNLDFQIINTTCSRPGYDQTTQPCSSFYILQLLWQHLFCFLWLCKDQKILTQDLSISLCLRAAKITASGPPSACERRGEELEQWSNMKQGIKYGNIYYSNSESPGTNWGHSQNVCVSSRMGLILSVVDILDREISHTVQLQVFL